MFKDVSPEELYYLKNQKHTLVDVRSPKEFEEATIPGAINIPLFSTEERALVGTIYNEEGQDAAKELGLDIFSKKLPEFIKAFKELGTPVTVFCWRGGMRSKTAATVNNLMNVPVSRLKGGIRNYRNWTKEQINSLPYPPLYVLNGHTGNGKTHILHQLKAEDYPVIDLEGMADHRGSIFGGIGRKPNNQRMFNLLLGEALLKYQDAPYILIEGESARIGKVTIPNRFYQHKEASPQLFVHLPIDERVKNILSDYSPSDHHDEVVEAFHRIKRRIHTPVAHEIEEALKNKDYHTVIKNLLIYYYDPRYDHSSNCDEELVTSIESQSVEDAIEKVKDLLSAIKKT
ncbi:tRNA 2-selenouridine(34) synthase MnmH [Alkalibacterium kapii]|uniref:tRNA 2-selenouridine synthase n=1 Tax=Alkalibacterium kapii TaxID=426704 RepID=A0A511AW03_9LACT|nr:tRNA 2-selenouridine(34) synthase MnmH [Alkalibacterium kapii]GEK91812.1 tRNA 2-selenouridine synthase [Alkalibacterium kapii]